MKKISLLLFATIVSLAATAQLNPYAYGLSSNWDPTTQILTVNFSLNDKNDKTIIIYAVDPNNKNTKYKIHEVAPSDKLNFSEQIKITGKLWGENTCLPVNKDLTFAVEVKGTANASSPGNPVYIEKNRPFSCHGVAVNNCQDSKDFGAVYVTECSNGISGNSTWGWLSTEGRSLLKYDPQLKFVESYQKTSDFSQRTNTTLEPHRVRVSEDGRIFVSSYNRNVDATKNQVDVWEFKVNSNGTHSFDPVIYHNYTANGVYGDRVCGMDVKGEGANLKILLCLLDESDGTYANSFQAYEYNIGSLGSGASTNTGTQKLRYRPGGYLQTTSPATSAQGAVDLARQKKWYFYSDGFVNVSYSGANKDNIILAIDYFNGNVYNTHMYCWAKGEKNEVNFNNDESLCSRIQIVNQKDHYYGGAGLLRYVYNGVEYALSGRAQFGEFNGDGTNSETSGRIQAYEVTGTTIATSSTPAYSKSDLKTRKIVNDIAMDCANNVYAVSFTDGANSTGVGSGRLLAYAMPYSGTVTTYCPTSNANANKYFRLPDRTTLHMNDTDEDELNRIVGNNSPVCDCDISLYRPMQADMFNTICLPFELDLSKVASLSDAVLMEFSGATLEDTESGEKILTLNFENVNSRTLTAYKPYLIKPTVDISEAVKIDGVNLIPSNGLEIENQSITGMDGNSIYFKGVVPTQTITPETLTLLLVADDRLAELTETSEIPGFRAYFQFASTPPQGMQARVSTSKNTTTGTEVVIDGQKVNIEKFLRDGRVYIRVGETLYTITGEKVIRL